MTRKETLLTRKYELQNELRILRGEQPYDLAERTTGWRFHEAVKESREYVLKQDIENLEKSIEKQKAANERAAATAAYFATPEGAAEKAQLETEKKDAAAAFNAHENERLSQLNAWIKNFLGEYWSVKFLSDDAVDFSIWDADKADFVFGQTIEIRCEKHYYFNHNSERFECNVGTTGCFNLEEQIPGDRARFYIDFGRFLTDGSKLTELKNFMFTFHDEREAIRDRVRNANARLDNPLGL